MICRNHVDVSAGVRRCSRCGVTFCKDCLVDIGGQPYCATCKGEQLLDVRSGVDRTNLEFAGIGRRFAAQLLDGLVIGVPVGIILVGFMIVSMNGNNPPTGIFFWMLVPSAITVVYEALMLKSRGQTLGKMAMKIRVAMLANGAVPAGQAGWIRAAVYTLPEVVPCCGFIFWLVNVLWCTWDKPYQQCLHDKAAKTVVVSTA